MGVGGIFGEIFEEDEYEGDNSSLSLYLSIHLPTHLFIHSSTPLPIQSSIHHPPIHSSVHHPPIHSSVHHSAMHSFIGPSTHPFIRQSIHPPIHPPFTKYPQCSGPLQALPSRTIQNQEAEG